jgi:F-type H+-transporting ATPase subunit gamma
MAGGEERVLRRRIKSVTATKKITRAMELIAASRIVKAQQRVQAAVPYSDAITETVKDLAAAGGADVSSPFLTERDPVQRACHIVMTADRGLCGAYNSNVIRAAEGEIKADAEAGVDYSLVLVGRRADAYFSFRNYTIDERYSGFSDKPTYEDAKVIGQRVVDMYRAGEVDKVELVYTRFVSIGTQEIVKRPLVPLETDVLEGGDATAHSGFEFEPGPAAIIESLLPRYIEARIYAALLNAAASEHAARQRAMKAATDNAQELITTLTRVMNRARQESITTEIMEIVSGAEAMRQDGVGSDDLVDATAS